MNLLKRFLPVIDRTRRWRLLWPAAIAALAIAMPAWANSDTDGSAERGLGAQAETLSAEALASTHAKGVEPQTPRASENPGVILWDETGSVRRTSTTQNSGSGSEQVISAGLSANIGTGGPAGVVGGASYGLSNAVNVTVTGLSLR